MKFEGIIYGPILSRRLGRSLGVNLLPPTWKICNFDCIYCELGYTQVQLDKYDPNCYAAPEAIIEAIEYVLKKPYTLDHISFSGMGEPTLHPQFHEIIKSVLKLRDRYKPDIQIAVFSNGTKANSLDIQKALNFVDKAILKLDAGNDDALIRINQPLVKIDLESIVRAYKTIDKCIIQSLFFGGDKGNNDSHQVMGWIEMLQKIDPVEVQVYTLARQTPTPGLLPLSTEELSNIADLARYETGLQFTVYN